jgi:branched-chain amino acid transport system substrate-binding protein
MRRHTVRMLAIAALVGLTGATAQAQTAARQPFGALLPLTGNAASSGTFEREAIDLAVSEANALGGMTFEPIYEDMAANPRMAVPATEKLANVDHVPFSLIGYSSVTLAAAPIAERAKLLLLNAGGSSSRLAGVSPYVFNSIPLADIQARVMLAYAVQSLGLKNIAIYYRNDDLGNDIADAVKAYLPKLGATLLASESFTPNAPDHRAQLSKLRVQRPQAVFVVGAGNETGIIVKQARELGLHTQWISYAGYENGNTLSIGGEAAEGGLYTVASVIGPDGNTYPAATAFYQNFEKRFGTPRDKVDYTAPQFYEATQLFVAAARTLHEAGTPITGDSLRDALIHLKNFHSVFGETRFRPNGTVLKPIAVKTVKGGRFEIVKVYTVDEIARLPE